MSTSPARSAAARTVVLSTESEEDYQAELRGYLGHFQPVGKPETDLVHQLAATNWRLARYAAIETALFENKMEKQAAWVDREYEELPDENRLAIAFDAMSGPGDSLGLLNRYQTRLNREYLRLIKAITDLQSARQAAEARLRADQNTPNEPKPADACQPPAPVSASAEPPVAKYVDKYYVPAHSTTVPLAYTSREPHDCVDTEQRKS
jgi:hypothetical protein